MDNCSGSNLCSVAWFYANIRGVCFMDNRGLYSFRRHLSCCALQALILLSLVLPSFAVEGEEASNSFYGFDSVNPVPVYIVPDDLSLDVSAYAAGDDFPFYGSAWVEGTASGFGTVQLFFPINRKEFVGLDSSGRIFNVSDNTWSGVMYDSSGESYTVNFQSFNLPRYRVSNGSSWDYETLYLTPSSSNLVLPDGVSPTYSVSELLPWVSVLLIGGILLCCMRKS